MTVDACLFGMILRVGERCKNKDKKEGEILP